MHQGIVAGGGGKPQKISGNVVVWRDNADAKNIYYKVLVFTTFFNHPTFNYRFYLFGGATLQDSSNYALNVAGDPSGKNYLCEITATNENGSISKTIGVWFSNYPQANPYPWNYAW